MSRPRFGVLATLPIVTFEQEGLDGDTGKPLTFTLVLDVLDGRTLTLDHDAAAMKADCERRNGGRAFVYLIVDERRKAVLRPWCGARIPFYDPERQASAERMAQVLNAADGGRP